MARTKENNFTKLTVMQLRDRVANLCSNPDCRKNTIAANFETIDKTTLIGEAAHICAASSGGPRFDPNITTAEIKSFENGIWLCSVCHKIVDREPLTYPVEMLKIWKNETEEYVRKQLGRNTEKDINFEEKDSTLDKLRDSVFAHNASILNAIRTEISVNQQKMKIERQNYVSEIEELTRGNKHVILSGEGGSGKTAILKEFYQQYLFDIPICIFKATELNVNHVSDLFRFEHNFSTADFLSAYENETIKLFIIDSAEKLADLSNQNILHDLVNSVTSQGWKIIFTTRASYLDDLHFHINESYQLQCKILEVELLSDEKLIEISNEFRIVLPNNDSFKDRLRNLFYLNEYIAHYQSTEAISDFASFIDLLWKKRIQNSLIKKDNIHIKRGRCLEKIAKQRADTNRFYITGDSLPQDALYQLKIDDIIAYDEQHDGYFITHDIYEEWALNHIINKVYQNHVNIEDFFNELGNSLAIRRAFRLWLSQKLIEEDTNIKRFINNVFISDISQFWKDELLVSVLLSEYSFEFFKIYENELIANDFSILKRMIFLLQVACKDVVSVLQNTRPKGRGWQATIDFIYKHQFDVLESNRNRVLPILLDWCQSNAKGVTTRLAGLLAVSILKKTEQEERIYSRDEDNNIYKVIFASCREIEKEIKEIFDKVIKYAWVEHNDPYQDFCVTILNKSYLAAPLIQLLPNSIIKLCEIYWTAEKDEDVYHSLSFNMHSETDYGLKEYDFSYSPASAYQTPLHWLLCSNSFLDAINFIIRFTNRSITTYAYSDSGKTVVEKVKIYAKGSDVIQYHSYGLWTMYRGFGSPVVPELLQSTHMSLEKFLLLLAKQYDSSLVQPLLLHIIKNSISTSLTSVVCSIVLAYPNKFYEVAKLLFRSIDLFMSDFTRSVNEYQAKSLYGMGYGLRSFSDELYSDERLKTCEEDHRNTNLEQLCLRYQLYGVEHFSESQNSDFIEEVLQIIDKHKTTVKTDGKRLDILLARMDRRNLKPEIQEYEDKTTIIFKTSLTEEQKKVSDQAHAELNEKFKYTSLNLWSNVFAKKEYESCEKYNSNPLLALNETKDLLDDLRKSSDEDFVQLNRNIVFNSCSKLIIEYSQRLSQADKDFCKEYIDAGIQRLFLDNYDYQISDGLEACTHALPKLIEEYPKDIEKLALLLIFILFDKYSIGAYKRVCDYAIEAIHKKGLWDSSPQVAEQIVNGFIIFKPLYNDAFEALQSSEDYPYDRSLSKSKTFEKFLELCKEKELGEQLDSLKFNSNELNKLDIDDLEKTYQLLPNNTTQKNHLAILNLTLGNVAKILLKDKRDTEGINNLYSLRLSIFKKISAISLYRNTEDEVERLLEPFINNLKRNDETEQFIERFIWSENEFYQPKIFWYIWKLLYPKIIELYSQGGYYKDFENLIINYLLAWRWWGEKQKEWQSLTEENLWLYSDTSKDLGNHPSVLYSIARVLNSVASNFHDLGIDWINTITLNNYDLKLGDVESDTLFNLENYLRQYIFLNRQRIKQDVRLKNKVITILNFMVERGSVHGYLLRENVL